MDIVKKHISGNQSSRNGAKIEYIVIHDTGNPRAGADAMNHYRYFKGGNRNASAHYFVDDTEIVQIIPDHISAWHVGDGGGKYGIMNRNSIGIEMCINSDGDYDKAYQKTIELTKYLMKKHNIPASKVVRHYDASRKRCPGTWVANDWERWKAFKNEIRGNHVATTQPKESEKYDGTVTASVLNIRSGPGTNHAIVSTLKRGDKVKINGQHGDWLEIDHGRWVAAKYIKILNEGGIKVDKDKPSKWHEEAWEWARLNQITDGTEPKRAATREEVATMIRRALTEDKAASKVTTHQIIQYSKGPLEVIEGPAELLEPTVINQPLHQLGRVGINGTLYDSNGSVMILAQNGEVLGPNAYWNGWDGPPRPVIYYDDTGLHYELVKNIYDVHPPLKAIKWAVGGGSLPYDAKERWDGDVTRKAERSALAFKDHTVYLISTKEKLTLPELDQLIKSHLAVDRAIFLDGGGSVQMYHKQSIIKSLRAVNNGLFFKEE